MKRSRESTAKPTRRLFLLAGAATAVLPLMKGHDEVSHSHLSDKSEDLAKVRTIQEGRLVIRQNVQQCIDECGVLEGVTLLRQCWSEKEIDGEFMASLDASFSGPVAEKVRTIARVLMIYPELAPEIPLMAKRQLRSASDFDPKRIGLCFLNGDLPLLNDEEHIQTSAKTYITIIEERQRMQHLLTKTD